MYDDFGNVATQFNGWYNITFCGAMLDAPKRASPTVNGIDIFTPVSVHFIDGVSASHSLTLVAYAAGHI